ncbi:IS607 family transposase [Vibrio crassostreae]|uniref:IS607 family transposase n=1 Tax=Vibrio crassostreae TaxID=246167 RepID=UPI001B30C3E5|nr:IS607 family transposase [Vibrio crassostreae]
MLKEKLLSIGETAEMLGVSVPTVRRWQKAGKIQEKQRTLGNHRRFSHQEINKSLGLEPVKKVVGYARVSTHDQKKDLETQRQRLINHGCDEVITDLGSGINCRKRGLMKLILLILSGEVREIVLTTKDRLLRFGHELIYKLCEWHGVEVLTLDELEEVPFETELVNDVICLMTVFNARLYGKRSHKNKKKNNQKPLDAHPVV